jgi:hypothetical protein
LNETTETPVQQLTPYQEWNAVPDADQKLSSDAEIETASETDPASDPDKPVVEEKEEKLPKGLKKRFSELTGEIRELRAQLAVKPAAGEVKPGVATLPEVKAAEPGKPVAANFETYEDFVEALTDFKADQRDALRAAVDARANQAQVVKTQVEAARAAHDDYDQVVNDQVKISAAMAEVLVASDHGAEIAYFLGSNPDEAARIFTLSPARAGAELAKIEASLDLTKASTPVKSKTAQSKAPNPPKILNGSGGNADAQPDPKDFAAWNKWMDRETKRKNADA